MKRRMFLASLFVSAVAALSAPVSATNISVNFVGGQNGPNGAGTVTTTAGLVPSGNWNNAAGASGAMGVINDTGAAAGTLSWSSPNTWAATGSAPAGGGSATMMSGYLDAGNTNFNTFTISGLGTDVTSLGYSILVYFNADSGGTEGFTAADNAGNTDTGFGTQSGGAGTNFPLAGPNGFVTSTATTFASSIPSNTILLEGFTGSSVTITGIVGSGGNRARPNGFQIIGNTIPEPATLSLLGCASLALLRRRRLA